MRQTLLGVATIGRAISPVAPTALLLLVGAPAGVLGILAILLDAALLFALALLVSKPPFSLPQILHIRVKLLLHLHDITSQILDIASGSIVVLLLAVAFLACGRGWSLIPTLLFFFVIQVAGNLFFHGRRLLGKRRHQRQDEDCQCQHGIKAGAGKASRSCSTHYHGNSSPQIVNVTNPACRHRQDVRSLG